MEQPASQQPAPRSRRKVRQGVVVSHKMDKSAVVVVEKRVRHPIYGKLVKRTKRYIVHDEENKCQEGDLVRIMECRPLSRHKSWRLVEIISRAKT